MTELYPYQKKGVKTIARFKGRALLADDMGLGKSIQALHFRHLLNLRRKEQGRKPAQTVVVCPASLKINWSREAQKHFNSQALILEGMDAPRSSRMLKPPLVIINYEILEPWMDYLHSLEPELVILDEVQRIRNVATQASENCWNLVDGGFFPVKYLIALSGTPIENKPAEFWNVLHMLRPDIFDSMPEFLRIYCGPKLEAGRWTYNGATRLEELSHRLRKHVMIRRRKSEVLTDLPAKQRIVLPLDIENRQEYDAALNDFKHWLRQQGKSLHKVRSKKTENLVKVGYLLRLAAKLKLKAVTDWVDQFLEDTDSKLLLFAHHKAIIKPLFDRYKDIAVRIDGSVTGRKRQLAVDTFNENRRIRLLIGNMQAAGEGLNLTAADTVAFAELRFKPSIHLQCEDRAHRIGQINQVTAYYLVAYGTIEERLCELIQTKQEIFDRVMDGSADVTLSVFNQLLESIWKGKTNGKRQKSLSL